MPLNVSIGPHECWKRRTRGEQTHEGESRPTKGEGRVEGASTKGEGWVAWVASRRVKRNREEKFPRLRLFLENLPTCQFAPFLFSACILSSILICKIE